MVILAQNKPIWLFFKNKSKIVHCTFIIDKNGNQ